MVHPCVYRHNVRCPECGSNQMPKDGTSGLLSDWPSKPYASLC